MTAEKMMELADELDSYNNESRVLPRATRVMQKAAMALRSLAVGADNEDAGEPLDDAIGYAKKALAALQSEPVQPAGRGMFRCNCPHEARSGCSEPRCAHYVSVRPEAPAGVRAVLDEVEAKAREWAGHYTPHSDGWNTFILFAEWVETLPSDPVRRTTQPIQRDSAARLDSGEVR